LTLSVWKAALGGAVDGKHLEAALWAFHDAQDFREAVLKAVNLGDDADTTGAVCGQFAWTFGARVELQKNGSMGWQSVA
jgi:ADP-ribosyl-[dinitrogen reductase] hydrolase